jgi:hypothetical protein
MRSVGVQHALAPGAVALDRPIPRTGPPRYLDRHRAGQPRGLEQVLCPDFEWLTGLALVCPMIGCLAEGIPLRSALISALDRVTARIRTDFELLVRCSLGSFSGIILTPELKTDVSWIPWLQLTMAGRLIWRRTMPLVGQSRITHFLYAFGRRAGSVSRTPRTAVARPLGTRPRRGARQGARDGTGRRRGGRRAWRGLIGVGVTRSSRNLDQSGASEAVHRWSPTRVAAEPQAAGCAQAHLTKGKSGVAFPRGCFRPLCSPIQRRSDLPGCCAVVVQADALVRLA